MKLYNCENELANLKKADELKSSSGGLMQGKKYMLSFTYNCPLSEFNNPQGFFEGMSVDQANVALHKTFQFCGATPLSSYAVHDVYGSNFNIEHALQGLHLNLVENFSK